MLYSLQQWQKKLEEWNLETLDRPKRNRRKIIDNENNTILAFNLAFEIKKKKRRKKFHLCGNIPRLQDRYGSDNDKWKCDNEKKELQVEENWE